MLTRKHFQDLADALAGISHDCSKVRNLNHTQAQIIYSHIRSVCIQHNPRFDIARFDARIRKTALELEQDAINS